MSWEGGQGAAGTSGDFCRVLPLPVSPFGPLGPLLELLACESREKDEQNAEISHFRVAQSDNFIAKTCK